MFLGLVFVAASAWGGGNDCCQSYARELSAITRHVQDIQTHVHSFTTLTFAPLTDENVPTGLGGLVTHLLSLGQEGETLKTSLAGLSQTVCQKATLEEPLQRVDGVLEQVGQDLQSLCEFFGLAAVTQDGGEGPSGCAGALQSVRDLANSLSGLEEDLATLVANFKAEVSWQGSVALMETITSLAESLKGVETAFAPCLLGEERCPTCAETGLQEALSEVAAAFSACISRVAEDSEEGLLGVLKGFLPSKLDGKIFHLAQSFVPMVNLVRQLSQTTQWPALFTSDLEAPLARCQAQMQTLWEKGEALQASLQECDQELSEAAWEGIDDVEEALSSLVAGVQGVVRRSRLSLPELEEPYSLTAPSSFFQATTTVWEAWADMLGQLNDALAVLTNKMIQGTIAYPYNATMVSVVQSFAGFDWGTLVMSLLEQARGCIAYPVAEWPATLQETLVSTQARLESLQKALEEPTCFQELEAACWGTTRQALLIQSLGGQTEEASLEALCNFMEDFAPSLGAYKEFMDASYGLFAPRELSFESLSQFCALVQNWEVKFWTPCAQRAQELGAVEIAGPVSSAFNEQMNLWQQALQSVAQLVQNAVEKVRAEEVITYRQTLVAALGGALAALQRAPNQLRGLATFFGSEPWTGYQQQPALQDGAALLSSRTLGLRDQISDLRTELKAKCCSEVWPCMSEFLEALYNAAACLEAATTNNPAYASFLFSSYDPHDFLVTFAQETGPLVSQCLNALIGEILSTQPSDDGWTCNSSHVLPGLGEMVSLAKQIAAQGREFCQHLNVALPQEFDAQSCHVASFDDLWPHLAKIAHSFRSVLEAILEMSGVHTYTVDSEIPSSCFRRLGQIFTEWAEALEKIIPLTSNPVCSSCGAWPVFQLKVLRELLSQSAQAAQSLGAGSSEVVCCQAYADELRRVLRQLKGYAQVQDLWLESVEKSVLQHLEYEHAFDESGLETFSQVMTLLLQRASQVGAATHGLVLIFEQIAEDKGEMPCHADSGVPFLRDIHAGLVKMNRHLRTCLTRETLKRLQQGGSYIEASTPCAERGLLSEAIFQSLGEVLTRWRTFSDRYQELDRLPHRESLAELWVQASDFLQTLTPFLTQLRDLCAESLFCPRCSLEGGAKAVLAKVLSVQEDPFQKVAQRSLELCPTGTYAEVASIVSSLQYLTGLLSELRLQPRLAQVLVDAAQQALWEAVLTPLEALRNHLVAYNPLPETSSCLAERLRPFHKGVMENIDGLIEVFGRIAKAAGLDVDRSLRGALVGNEEVVGIFPEVLANLNGAWHDFCSCLDGLIPDTLRKDYARLLTSIGERVNQMTPSFSLFDDLAHQTFCNGQRCVVLSSDQIQEAVLNLVMTTRMTVRDLHGNNCCDTHARCLYNLTRRLHCLSALPRLPFEAQAQLVAPYLLQLADVTDRMQQKLAGRAPESDCVQESLKEEFEGLETLTEQFEKGLCQQASLAIGSFADWEDFSASTRDDCAYLKDLYPILAKECQGGLRGLIGTANPLQKAGLLACAYSCEMLATSLKGLAELFSMKQPLCSTCATALQRRTLRHMAEGLEDAARFFQHTLESFRDDAYYKAASSCMRTLNQALGGIVTAETPYQVEVALPRRAVDHAQQQMTGFTKLLQQIAEEGNDIPRPS